MCASVVPTDNQIGYPNFFKVIILKILISLSLAAPLLANASTSRKKQHAASYTGEMKSESVALKAY